MPVMQVADFCAYHFKGRTSSRAAAHCGDKEDFTDPRRFWMWSLQQAVQPDSDDFRVYAEESSCDAIPADEYFHVIDGFSAMLKRPEPEFLTQRFGFLRATQVLHEAIIYNTFHAGYLAEYQSTYVAFHSWIFL